MRFFTKQINPRSLGSWCVKGTDHEESTSRMDSPVPLKHHDPNDLGLIGLIKKRKIHKCVMKGAELTRLLANFAITAHLKSV